MAKTDKKSFMERLAEEAGEVTRIQDFKTLYRITKTLSGGLKNSDVPVKDTGKNTSRPSQTGQSQQKQLRYQKLRKTWM